MLGLLHTSPFGEGGVGRLENCVAEIYFSSGMLGRQGERDKHAQASGTQSQRKEFGKKLGSVSQTDEGDYYLKSRVTTAEFSF